MVEVYYAPRKGKSSEFVSQVLSACYGLNDLTFFRSATGKPYCNAPVRFSLSHTRKYFFLAVSAFSDCCAEYPEYNKINVQNALLEFSNETGIDAEDLSRQGNYSAVIAKLSKREREAILDKPELFLPLWTKIEAVCKCLSLPVFSALKELQFEGEVPLYQGKSLPFFVKTFNIENHAVSLCVPKDKKIGKIFNFEGV